ncbi:MAG TPA: bifunctional [glutamate--ammonia ligase]-adenylyl-L-tyrosine phosphorylase/[glutamate--ammonia-ligase] adenylyltransferase, partial [Pseudomonadales bacterium]|nr:bifunctional [glutamate--ammonia ligase]-adenylyl-L-tyrosine phosphorylase/[glutamate--ammonia-ligase] adenylyltransferase [Pseudomonadales bacterium]
MTELAAVMRQVERDIQELDLPPARCPEITRIASLSEYFYRILMKTPDVIADLFASGDMDTVYDEDVYRRRLSGLDHEALDAGLRRHRAREMCRIIFRDLSRISSLEETTRDLSNLADASIETALDVHYKRSVELWGTPVGATTGRPQQMCVLALGKLGAQELNLSSDVDLVFMYDEPGHLEGGARDMTNQEFFIRVARALIASLDAIREEGFVFRVDMRLRPYGESGALILARSAMESYFVEQGRDWERYAFIKARACAGNIPLGDDFLLWLVPFVYRKHLDYGAIESLREMKRLINYEVGVRELHDDLKLGHGGIREIEFIAQAYQIIWGGNRPELRVRRLMTVLEILQREGMLPAEDTRRLIDAYRFLRDSEHVVQAEQDRQTQRLPGSPLSQQRLAEAMGYADFEQYARVLAEHREAVMQSFETFISSSGAEREGLVEGNLYWIEIWRQPTAPDSIKVLAEAGYGSAETVASRLVEFESHLQAAGVQEIGASRIDQLMPVVLRLVASEEAPEKTLDRLLAIIDNIARRSTYIAFLLENVDALKRTVQLCAMSPWVAEQLQRYPILLYELTDRVTEEMVFTRSKLEGELDQLFYSLESGDLEGQMDSLRQFRNSSMLKVAVFELLDLLPIMKASDALTDIAEIILQRSFELAWQYLR